MSFYDAHDGYTEYHDSNFDTQFAPLFLSKALDSAISFSLQHPTTAGVLLFSGSVSTIIIGSFLSCCCCGCITAPIGVPVILAGTAGIVTSIPLIGIGITTLPLRLLQSIV